MFTTYYNHKRIGPFNPWSTLPHQSIVVQIDLKLNRFGHKQQKTSMMPVSR